MTNKKSALLTVFLVVLVDLLGFGIILPLLPFFAARFDAGPVTIGLLYSCYSLMQLLFSPLWGTWSDRIGRRPIMLLSTLGSSLSYVMFAFCGSLPLLFASRILAGIMGGNISAAQAAIADVTPPAERAKGMGLLGAAFGIGFMLGPALAGILHGPEDRPFLVPGLFAAGLSAMSFFLVLTRLPETLDRSASADGLRIEKAGIFTVRFWSAFTGGASNHLPLLLASSLLLAVGHSSLYSSFPLFCKNALSLDARTIAGLFAVMGIAAVFVQGGLIRILVKKFGEHSLFTLGCAMMIAGLALIPFSANTVHLTAALLILAVGASLNGPTLTSLLSQEAAAGRIGSVMGTSQGLSALGRVIGPTWGGLLFSIGRPLPFWATAGLLLSTLWIAFQLAGPRKERKSS